MSLIRVTKKGKTLFFRSEDVDALQLLHMYLKKLKLKPTFTDEVTTVLPTPKTRKKILAYVAKLNAPKKITPVLPSRRRSRSHPPRAQPTRASSQSTFASIDAQSRAAERPRAPPPPTPTPYTTIDSQ